MRVSQHVRLQAAVLAGGIVLAAGAAGAQGSGSGAQGVNVPDAQVEANVLRQLASAPELSAQNIQSTTVYGTVTLTGNVQDETMRSKAENLAARAPGVKKVVDELTLGEAPAAAGNDSRVQGDYPGAQSGTLGGQVLQSDGTYAPASASPNGAQGSVPSQGQSTYPAQPGYPGAPQYGNPTAGQPRPNQQGAYNSQQPYNGQPGQAYPGDQQAYGNAPPPPPGYGPQGYGSQGNGAQGYGAQGYGPQGPPQRQPMYPNGYAQSPQGGAQGGQVGGQTVTVSEGSVLRVRVDRGFDANHVTAGTQFSGVVMQDIVANGAVAIPRGAAVQGTVIDAKKAGVLKGEGELGLQINTLTLGGQNYALNTDVWQREGRDKTVSTVNSALGLGAVGAILGGVAGGGAGAAIGAGVGGAAGVAGSAASPGGRVIVPAEAVLTFRIAQPATVTTVGQAELSRLSYAAGPAARPVPPRRYYSPYYGYYYR